MPVFAAVFCAPGGRGSCRGCWAEAAVAPAAAWSAGMASGRASPAPHAGSSSVPQCGHLGVRPRQAEPGLPGPEHLGFGFGKSAPMAQRIAVNECWTGLPKAVSQSMKILGFLLYLQT